jgi:hypothetical protein
VSKCNKNRKRIKDKDGVIQKEKDERGIKREERGRRD